MADNTKIEWTRTFHKDGTVTNGATWGIITGCSVRSAGCRNCYAMKLAGTRLRHHPSRAGLTIDTANGPVWNGQVRFNQEWLDQPLRWSKSRKVFVCAHSDLFHESVPDEWIDKVFAVMALAHRHIFQVLTKRPERMRKYLENAQDSIISLMDQPDWVDLPGGKVFPRYLDSWPLKHVHLGISAENQQTYDERVIQLLQTPAAVRWISAEPLLGAVDLRLERLREWNELANANNQPWAASSIDWVVVGGESGPNARPMHPDWARSLRDQCETVGVPFLFKQWGEYVTAGHPSFSKQPGKFFWIDSAGKFLDPPPENDAADCITVKRVGKKAAGRLLDGIEYNGYPK
jgi:protein gp37